MDNEADLIDDDSGGPFRCPECGSQKEGDRVFISIEPNKKSKNPWDGVLQIIRCAGCKKEIPAHLGERWGGISYPQACEEWRKDFKGKRH